MQMSQEIDKLAKALSLAQAEIEGADKNKSNPAFKSKYADLSSVWDAIRPVLPKHGLSVVQLGEPKPLEGEYDLDKVAITTMLLHESGQWISGTMWATPVKKDPQGIGSCVTYLRRYGLSAIVGVCPDDDDDGNAASGRPTPPTTQRQPTPPPVERTAEKQEEKTEEKQDALKLLRDDLKRRCKDAGINYVAAIAHHFGDKDPKSLTADELGDLMDKLLIVIAALKEKEANAA